MPISGTTKNTPTHCRAYAGPADLERMIALVKQRPAARILNYPAPADLEELLAMEAIQAATRLWLLPDGRLAGYSLVNHQKDYIGVAFERLRGLEDAGLEAELLDWGETFFRQHYQGSARELSTSVRADQIERIALLEQRGFTRCPESTVYLERSLAEPLETPCPPAGYTLRPLRGEQEAAAWVVMHRAAFGTENMTLETKLAMIRSAHNLPDLDLVAEAPDGSLAAYVVGSIHPGENAITGRRIGWTDPIATHPSHQRRGLCHALLLETMRRLKEHGIDTARLGTSSDNLRMRAAAQAAGFQAVEEAFQYEKALPR